MDVTIIRCRAGGSRREGPFEGAIQFSQRPEEERYAERLRGGYHRQPLGLERCGRGDGFWQALGKAGKAEGLYWGGDWRSFKDWAHLQFFPNTKLSEVRKESGLA